MARVDPYQYSDDDYYNPPPANTTTQQSASSPTSAASVGSADWPGRRLFNPLGKFASYTYQLSLYVITPDAYDAFIASGRTRINVLRETADGGNNISGGAYLIAQSGGITPGSDIRAPGFELDYYIENLTFKTLVQGPRGLNSYDFKFDIIEPYGFSFITKLALLSESIENRYSNSNYAISKSLKQFYILGIRFNGYDAEGNIYTGKNSLTGEADLDAAATGSGLYDFYYDIMFKSLKFKLDGKQTVYNIEATICSLFNAFSFKRGILNEGARVKGATVGELVDELVKQKTIKQQNLVDDNVIQEANTYSVVWEGEGVDKIKNAPVVTLSDKDKSKLPNASVNTSGESSDAASITAVPDTNSREFAFRTGSTILEAIKTIIANSKYAEDALTAVYNSNKPYEDNTQTTNPADNPGSMPVIKWYNISSKVSRARWDNYRQDWAYDITYIIRPYDTPSIQTAYSTAGSSYYGPHKRYRYWLTGENSEIIAYEQVFNNLYFLAMHRPKNENDNNTDQPGGAPKVELQMPELDRAYKLDTGSVAVNAYLTNLQDESAWVRAKFTILGDPDFLMTDSLAGTDSDVGRYYGYNGFSINPNKGQIFIEIDFKEGVDYDNNTGLLTINESIIFWKYPPSIASRVKGVVYLVREVISSFQGGKFLQTIDATVATFPEPTSSENSESGTREAQETAATSNTATGSDLKKESKPSETPQVNAYNPQAAVNRANRGTETIDY